jgi:hypothetical protein
MPATVARLGAPALLASLTLLAGCAAAEPEPQTRRVEFAEVRDATGSEFYTVTDAVGVSDQFGSRVVLFFDITNANQIKINPRATVRFADGGTMTCQEEDLRRLPSLVESTTDWDIPCDGAFPEVVEGATVEVVDTYH